MTDMVHSWKPITNLEHWSVIFHLTCFELCFPLSRVKHGSSYNPFLATCSLLPYHLLFFQPTWHGLWFQTMLLLGSSCTVTASRFVWRSRLSYQRNEKIHHHPVIYYFDHVCLVLCLQSTLCLTLDSIISYTPALDFGCDHLSMKKV